MLGNLLGGFITILVGVNLIPTIGDTIYAAKYDSPNNGNATNVTGVSATLITLTVLFYAIGVMSSGVALAVIGLKNAGIMR